TSAVRGRARVPCDRPEAKEMVMSTNLRPEAASEATDGPLEAAELPAGIASLGDALRDLADTLPALKAALARQAQPQLSRMPLRLDEVAACLGVSRRVIERERAAGRFPPPDLHVGRVPLYQAESIRAWIQRGGR